MIKVSVIVPVYKTERYLRECLDSLVGQTLADIEIVIVNDGSPDNSQLIIDEYASRHANVKAFEIANSGQAVARNLGISQASGEFIAFVDSDDRVPLNVYQRLYAKATEADVDVVAGVLQSFSSKGQWIHEIQLKCFSADLSGITIEEYGNLILDGSPCNKLIRRDFITRHGIHFYEGLYWKEDWYFCMQLYFYGARVSLTTQVVYFYRAREDLANPSATQDFRSFDAVKFMDMVNALDRICIDHRSRNIKDIKDAHLLASLIAYVRRYREKMFERDVDMVMDVMCDVLASSGGGVFARLELFDDLCCRLLAAGKREDARRFLQDDTFKSYLKTASRESVELSQIADLGSKLEAHFDALEKRIAHLNIDRSRLWRQLEEVRNSTVWRMSYPVRRAGDHAKRRLSGLRQRVKARLAHVVASIVQVLWAGVWKQFRRKPLILIGERQRLSMEDNGYVFFNYLRTRYPGQTTYFVYDKSRFDIGGAPAEDGFLAYGSVRYWLTCLLADCYVVTDCIRDIADHAVIKAISRFRHVVFLQHGIIGHRKLNSYYGKVSCESRGFYIKTFLVSSDFERDLVARELGFDQELFVSGLPRYDLLRKSDEQGKQVLIAPTWRQWLRHEDQRVFEASEYWRHWVSLLTNPGFHEMLAANGARAVFYPHFAMHKYLQCFRSGSDSLLIADPSSTSLGALIRESSMLITDYSSVAFDFMYKRSPVIFYQFDADQFHWDAGGPPPISGDELVGEVAYGERELLALAREYLRSGQPSADRVALSDRYYKYRDGENCERIYRHILSEVR